MRLADGSYSGAALLLATGGALLAGAALGYTVALRTLRRGGGGGRRPGSRALMPSLNLSGLGSWESSSAGGSGWATPSETPRTGSGSDLAAMNVKMALIVRQDIPLVGTTCWRVGAHPCIRGNRAEQAVGGGGWGGVEEWGLQAPWMHALREWHCRGEGCCRG